MIAIPIMVRTAFFIIFFMIFFLIFFFKFFNKYKIKKDLLKRQKNVEKLLLYSSIVNRDLLEIDYYLLYWLHIFSHLPRS